MNPSSTEPCVIGTSGVHRAYVVFGEPLPPWSNAPGDQRNAWVSALDFVFSNGFARTESTTNAMASITTHLFSGHGMVYDTLLGRPSFVFGKGFDLSGYMNHLSPHNGKYTNIVNCVDQALALSLLGRLVGITAHCKDVAYLGYIEETDLVGVGRTNNPFFDNPYNSNDRMCGRYDSNRSSFRHHAFVSLDDMIFDACAGPSLGTRNRKDYLDATIDQQVPNPFGQSPYDTNNVSELRCRTIY